TVYLNNDGHHATDLPPVDYSLRAAHDAFWDTFPHDSDPQNGPSGARLVDRGTDPIEEPAEIAQLVADRYQRSMQLSRTVASVHDVPITWFWQPLRDHRDYFEGEPKEVSA